MGEFKYIPPREVDARHRAAARPSNTTAMPRGKRTSELKNVEAVLSLGDAQYFIFHNYLMAIPPVPYKLGQKILAIYTRSLADAQQVTKTGDQKAIDSYYRQLTILSKLMWGHVRLVKHWRRVLKRFGLIRNVFADASEKEMQELCNFFLQCRMMSNVQATEMGAESSTPMSSMNSKSS